MPTDASQQDRRVKLRARVEQASNLPTLPDIVLRIAEMVDSPTVSGRQLGAEIARDQVISAKVLKLVNSGFYGFTDPIATVPHAVALLGFNAMKSLVLSCSVLDTMNEVFPGLWEHSLACARTSVLLSEHLGISGTEELATCGLLHDLGKVVIHQTLASQFTRIRLRVEKAGALLYEAEREVLGVDHGEVAGWLLAKWALPATIIAPIAEHHDFKPRRDHAERTAIVHIADILVRAEGLGNGGDRKIPRLNQAALATLDLRVDDLRAVMDRMNEEMSDIERM